MGHPTVRTRSLQPEPGLELMEGEQEWDSGDRRPPSSPGHAGLTIPPTQTQGPWLCRKGAFFRDDISS